MDPNTGNPHSSLPNPPPPSISTGANQSANTAPNQPTSNPTQTQPAEIFETVVGEPEPSTAPELTAPALSQPSASHLGDSQEPPGEAPGKTPEEAEAPPPVYAKPSEIPLTLKVVNRDPPETASIVLRPHDTLSAISWVVSERLRVPLSSQALVYNGQKISGEEATLEELGILPNATVCVIDTAWKAAAATAPVVKNSSENLDTSAAKIQALVRGGLARKRSLNMDKETAEEEVDIEALKRIAALPAAYSEAKMELPEDELKQPCGDGIAEVPQASGEDNEGDDACPRGPLLGEEDSSLNTTSGLDLDKMGLPKSIPDKGVEDTTSGIAQKVRSNEGARRMDGWADEADTLDASEEAMQAEEEEESSEKASDLGIDEEKGHSSEDEMSYQREAEAGTGKPQAAKKVSKEEIEVDLEAEFDEDSDEEEQDPHLYSPMDAVPMSRGGEDISTTSTATATNTEAEIKPSSTGNSVANTAPARAPKPAARARKKVFAQRDKEPVQCSPKRQPGQNRSGVHPPPRRSQALSEENVVIPPQRDYSSICGSIKDPRSLYALFRVVHEDIQPYRKSILSNITPALSQLKSPLKASLTGSNRPLLFGPVGTEHNDSSIGSLASTKEVKEKESGDSESSSKDMASTILEEQTASSARSAQMEQTLSTMRRRAEQAQEKEWRRINYVQRAVSDQSIAKEIASTLLTARQQNKLVLTTPAESVGYWIYTEGWGSLLAAFEIDKRQTHTQAADDSFMAELRKQIRSKGSVNGELVRQYMNCILKGLSASKELASKVRGIPLQQEIPPNLAWSFGKAGLAFRRVFLSYYSAGLFEQVEADIELHCKLVEDAMNDLHAFQSLLSLSLVWHFPHLIAATVRDQSGTFGKVLAEAFQHKDSRQGSSFLSVTEARDVVSACVEDAVVNPLMDNLYLFFHPICQVEDRAIVTFCDSVAGENDFAAEVFQQFQDGTWSRIMQAATAAIDQGFQQRTVSSKLRSMTEALQIVLLHERARANEEVLVNAYL